ncbi:hypothetical protein [Streptomyces sp. NPDC001933]|uniref:hypothetical protein n=1 Tax=Streptomyces sp. NPDC001933 TaxID=3364626 RepID=UPI0036756B6D
MTIGAPRAPLRLEPGPPDDPGEREQWAVRRQPGSGAERARWWWFLLVGRSRQAKALALAAGAQPRRGVRDPGLRAETGAWPELRRTLM